MRAHAVSLTARQLFWVNAATSSLPPHLHDRFRCFVSDHLSGHPSDDAVIAIVNAGLDRAIAFASGTDHRYDDEFQEQRRA